MAMFYGMRASGIWSDTKGENLLDGGAHFYDTYETSDGKWISLGSIEPQFYALLLEKTGVKDPEFEAQMDRSKWPSLKDKISKILKTKTRDQWNALMEASDVCYAPVLSIPEATKHPHNVARKTIVEIDGVPQPGPAPRFSRTESKIQGIAPSLGQHTEQALKDWGFSASDLDALKKAEAI
jgi:alpha-methylacyl-CoA racemase